MSSHWSLVLFTLLVQATVGSLWTLLAGRIAVGELEPHAFYLQLIVLLVLVVVGLIAAMAHLGSPSKSIGSLRKLRSSQLSQEIFCVNLFAAVLILMTVVVYLRPDFSQLVLLISGSVAGGAVLYSMVRVYLIKTVPAWNHVGTPLVFVGSALLLGGLINFLQQQIIVSAPDPLAENGLLINVLFIMLGFFLKILASSNWPSRRLDKRRTISLFPVLQLTGLLLMTLATALNSAPLLVLLPVLIVALGEYVERRKFYHSYQRVGL